MRNLIVGTVIMLIFVLGFIASPTVAAPVIYQDGKMIDIIIDSKLTDVQVFDSLTSQWALGYRYFKETNQDPRHLFQVNGLVHRWNEPESQANVYLMGGPSLQNQVVGGYLGAQADWETRRYYISVATDQFFGRNPLNQTVSRVGFAPYLAEYDELNTWFILQATQLSDSSGTSQWILPMVRLFKDNILVEFGTNGQLYSGTFRVHF